MLNLKPQAIFWCLPKDALEWREEEAWKRLNLPISTTKKIIATHSNSWLTPHILLITLNYAIPFHAWIEDCKETSIEAPLKCDICRWQQESSIKVATPVNILIRIETCCYKTFYATDPIMYISKLADSCKPWGIYYRPELSLMDFALWSPVEFPGTMKGSHSVVTVLMSHLEADTHNRESIMDQP